MIQFVIGLVLTLVVCTTLQGCTYRAWYTGFQDEQKMKCYDNPSQTQIQQSLDRVNMSYDEYDKSRQESRKQSR